MYIRVIGLTFEKFNNFKTLHICAMTYLDQIHQTVEYIQNTFNFNPEFGIILGTGLGALVDEINIQHELDYDTIPNFPVSTVESHKGRLIFGELSGRKIIAMQGRFHCYEGYNMKEVTFPIKIMKALGIQKLFISNAAGVSTLIIK